MRVNAYIFTGDCTPKALCRALRQLSEAACHVALPYATARLLMYTHKSFWASVGGAVVGGAAGGTVTVVAGGVGMATGLVTGGMGGCLRGFGAVMRNVFSAYAVVTIFGGPEGSAVLLNNLCTCAWELFWGIPSGCKCVRGGEVHLFPSFFLSLPSASAINRSMIESSLSTDSDSAVEMVSITAMGFTNSFPL